MSTILSRYNIPCRRSDGLWLANSFSSSVIRLSDQDLNSTDLDLSAFTPEELDCLLDHGFAVPSEIDEVLLTQQIMEAAKWTTGTLTVTIAPSMGCNFSCSYCFEKKTADFKNKRRLDETTESAIVDYIVSNLKGRRGLHIRWFGGEPLLALDSIERISNILIQICDLADVEYSAEIQTNGYMLDLSSIARLSKCRVHHVHISLDGYDVEHDRVRFTEDGKGTYSTIIRNVDLCANEIGVTIRVNVTNKNHQHANLAIKDIASIRRGRNIGIYFHPVYAFFNGNEPLSVNPSIGFSSVREYARVETKLYQELQSAGFPFSWSFLASRSLPCSAVKPDGLMIDPSGNILKCDHEFGVPEKACGHVTTGITDVDKLTKWSSLHPKDNPYCSSCELLPTCLGYCASLRAQISLPEDACPSKKFNYLEILELGISTLKQPITETGRVSVYRRAARNQWNSAVSLTSGSLDNLVQSCEF